MTGERQPPRFPLAGEESSPLETVALGTLAVTAAVTALLWATGEAAGRLFEGQWPPVGAAEDTTRDLSGDPERGGNGGD